MATTVISGDLHGRLTAARELFERLGMIRCPSDDPFADERQAGFHHIQLGDAVSLGYGEIEADVKFLGYYDREEIRREVDQDTPRMTGRSSIRGRVRPQIVGHSGYLGPCRFGSLDGGVAALLTDDDGVTLRLEQVDGPARSSRP